ncbi:hypothetical protein [Sulfurospirillum multivorans]|uniref:Uncharacterized protein n=1 Tax=Sulfurospirillum multivorans TaxID=66821 RepID=A0ABX5Z1G2_SULMU|nr:hypothetical protein [Sulfurospirillum multivorans]QEH06731.1 hypothetical protein SMN_1966 [Sulfurospirillum multivorans]
MKCLVCGKPIIFNDKCYRCSFGRPKTYCSDHCRDFTKYFNAMVKHLDQIELDDEHKRKIRGDISRVGNSLKFPTIVDFSTKRP